MGRCNCPPYDCAEQRAKALADDQDAYAELERKFTPLVKRIVKDVFGPELSAEWDDARQMVFIAAFRKLDQWKGRAPFCTWIMKIAINTSKNFKKSAMRSQSRLIRPAPADIVSENTSIDVEIRDCIENVLRSLPAAKRKAFGLDAQEVNHSEIADSMDISLRTIQYWLAEVRQLLLPCLQK